MWRSIGRCRGAPRPAPGQALGQLAAVIDPAQLVQAVIGDLARHVIKRIAQNMHLAALPHRTRPDLADCLLEALMVIGHDKLDPEQPTLFQPR